MLLQARGAAGFAVLTEPFADQVERASAYYEIDRPLPPIVLPHPMQNIDEAGIELKATWREEWVVNPDRRYTHGGILAALVDLAADWALVKRTGRGVPTVDMRVDYHAAAMPGDLVVKGRVVRGGGQFSTAEAYVYDESGKLLASLAEAGLTAADIDALVFNSTAPVLAANPDVHALRVIPERPTLLQHIDFIQKLFTIKEDRIT